MVSSFRGFLCVGAVSLLMAAPALAADTPQADGVLSAKDLLVRINGAPLPPVPAHPAEPTPDNEEGEIKIKGLREITGRYSPTPAATAPLWLEELEKYWRSPAEYPKSFEELTADLPGPGAWPRLSALLKEWRAPEPRSALRTASARVIVYFLNGELAKAEKALAELDTAARGIAFTDREAVFALIEELRSFLAQGRKTAAPSVIDGYRRTIEAFAPTTFSDRSIVVPDLAAHVGPAETAALIEQTLGLRYAEITVPSAGETARLMRNTVMERPEIVASPPWDLVRTVDDVELFETIRKRFPRSVRKVSAIDFNQERRRAMVLYLLGLIARDRHQDAMDFAAAVFTNDMLESDLGSFWDRIDHSLMDDRLFLFLDELLEARPRLDILDEYLFIALLTGNRDTLLARLDGLAARDDLSPLERQELVARSARARLAADDMDGALARLRQILAASPPLSGKALDELEDLKFRTARSMARLGILLDRPALVDEGLAAAATIAKSKGARAGAEMDLYALTSLTDDLVNGGRYGEAQEMLAAHLAEVLSRAGGVPSRTYASREMSNGLVHLLKIYSHLGRHGDVLDLLLLAPWWGADDLASLDGDIWPAAAMGLHGAGRTTEGLAVARARLYSKARDDRAYEALVEIADGDVLPFLDELHVRDRFEERPLIWKASILAGDGEFEKAEEAVRAALGIDPTDGEQPAGDRVRAYGVLADILAARGKDEDAAFFRDIVRSVRIAEEGDRYRKAGLLGRSLERYAEAETAFADAYCVQWRIAERLYAQGDMAGAEKHYRIAFERMPGQFGQVASLCFGCEGIFDRERSRKVAEEVLGHLLETDVDRPQVHYLVGQLREAQQRPREAFAAYARSLELDPDYLDALEKMYGMRDTFQIPVTQLDGIILDMLRLDPLHRHVRPDLNTVFDMKRLWRELSAAGELAVDAPGQLLRLEASGGAMAASSVAPRYGGSSSRRRNRDAGVLHPGIVIANHSVPALTNDIMTLIEEGSAGSRRGESGSFMEGFIKYLFR